MSTLLVCLEIWAVAFTLVSVVIFPLFWNGNPSDNPRPRKQRKKIKISDPCDASLIR